VLAGCDAVALEELGQRRGGELAAVPVAPLGFVDVAESDDEFAGLHPVMAGEGGADVGEEPDGVAGLALLAAFVEVHSGVGGPVGPVISGLFGDGDEGPPAGLRS